MISVKKKKKSKKRVDNSTRNIVHKLLLLLYLLAAGHCICRCSTLIYLTITAFNHSAVFHVCVDTLMYAT